MSYPYYRAETAKPLELDVSKITLTQRSEQNDPQKYRPDRGLVDAVNVALLLGQPLLITGEPGTGKTQLAYSVSWQLGLNEPLKFETKSTSTARDLFYSYDTLARFHAAQTNQGSQNNLDYITYNALGIALLRANPEYEVARLIPARGFEHGGQRRSVVLIDEIDKAPRDFPNDILNEVEGMYFKIPELENAEIEVQEGLRPILILTSNSEKHLPDAFLRRCIYYNIPFPEADELRKIVETRMGRFKGGNVPWLSTAMELFFELREPNSGLNKKPATAELLNWLTVLPELFHAEQIPLTPETLRTQVDSGSPNEKKLLVEKSLSTLLKLADDHDRASIIVKLWSQKSAKS